VNARRKKMKVGVLFGGQSAEHEVSVVSAQGVMAAIDNDRFQTVPIGVTRQGTWLTPAQTEMALDRIRAERLKSLDEPLGGGILYRVQALSSLRRLDVVFPLIHGTNGEDGTLQGLLDLLGIPYVGSGTLSSALAMDKVMAKKVLAADGVPVPAGTVVDRASFARDALREARRAAQVALPAIVKPVAQGSSVGLSLVSTAGEMGAALERALVHDPRALVEERLSGIEITVGVLGNRDLQALPVVEIVSRHALFDYQSKYDPTLSEEICPARLPEATALAAQDLALRAHRSLACRGLSRTDMIVTAHGPVVLEVNTLPGMTVNSLLPKAARAAGIDFPELLHRLVQLALEPAD
jgi:D-alanine-D-alanine ligase